MQSKRHQQIERIEIIERTLEEGTRPLTSTEVLAFQPFSSVKESTEKFISTGTNGDEIEQGFDLTSERNAGRDPSLLYNTSVGEFSQPPVSPPIHQSTPERSTSINKYDRQEIQTYAGLARIVEPYGDGKIAGQFQNSPCGILKNAFVPEGSWRKSPISDRFLFF